jgi:exonuclease III
MRVTAIIARKDFHTTHIDILPSGRAIINLYAPSGTAKRTERERFFNVELLVLFSEYTNPMLTGGDFNCVLKPVDSTGPFTNSNALVEIVRGHVGPRSTPSHIHALLHN